LIFFEKWLKKKGQTLPEEGNPALVHAMHAVALQDNPDNREYLYSVLLRSMLIIPVPEAPAGSKPGLNTAAGNVELQMITIQDKESRKVTPVFSDVVALRNWDPNTPYVGLKAQDLFKILVTTDVQAIIVNPFDPIRKMVRTGGRITRAEFDALAQGNIPALINPALELKFRAGQQLAIGVPAKKPRAEVLESLIATANSMPEVKELYLFQLAAQADGAWSSHTVIGVNLAGTVSEDQKKQVVQGLGRSVQGKLGRGESLDFTMISDDSEQVTKSAILVFQRS
jgi:hypothetical protein